MRGLTDQERAVLLLTLQDTDHSVWLTPEQAAVSDRLAARGLLRDEVVNDDRWEWDQSTVTPLGELALRLDTAARGSS